MDKIKLYNEFINENYREDLRSDSTQTIKNIGNNILGISIGGGMLTMVTRYLRDYINNTKKVIIINTKPAIPRQGIGIIPTIFIVSVIGIIISLKIKGKASDMEKYLQGSDDPALLTLEKKIKHSKDSLEKQLESFSVKYANDFSKSGVDIDEFIKIYLSKNSVGKIIKTKLSSDFKNGINLIQSNVEMSDKLNHITRIYDEINSLLREHIKKAFNA